MKKFIRYTDENMTIHFRVRRIYFNTKRKIRVHSGTMTMSETLPFFQDIARLVGYDWLTFDGELSPYIDGKIHYGSSLEEPFINN